MKKLNEIENIHCTEDLKVYLNFLSREDFLYFLKQLDDPRMIPKNIVTLLKRYQNLCLSIVKIAEDNYFEMYKIHPREEIIKEQAEMMSKYFKLS